MASLAAIWIVWRGACWIYLGMAAAVPMVTTVALVTGNGGNIRDYLVMISLGGMAAFGLVLCLFQRTLRDLATFILDRRRIPDHRRSGGT